MCSTGSCLLISTAHKIQLFKKCFDVFFAENKQLEEKKRPASGHTGYLPGYPEVIRIPTGQISAKSKFGATPELQCSLDKKNYSQICLVLLTEVAGDIITERLRNTVKRR